MPGGLELDGVFKGKNYHRMRKKLGCRDVKRVLLLGVQFEVRKDSSRGLQEALGRRYLSLERVLREPSTGKRRLKLWNWL